MDVEYRQKESELGRAIRLVGSQSELARRLGIKPQAVQQWVSTGRVPAERVPQIVAATGGAVAHHDLRPDLWPEDNAA